MALSKEEADYKEKVRAQNDNVRRNILSSLPMRVQANAQCEVYLTTALAEMCRRKANMGDLLKLVKDFDDFNEGNDPWSEHDFGTFEFAGTQVLFKFDYYDLNLEGHSPDASDPAVTKRVLTIMLSADY
jgi:hypothetical protein